jgi:hypothetical protein
MGEKLKPNNLKRKGVRPHLQPQVPEATSRGKSGFLDLSIFFPIS